jgi:hypothetical protein
MKETFAARLESLDLSLFEAIPTQTTREDRRVLLAVQRYFHRRGAYSYLEVGSHLGGSLQSFFLDPRCTRLTSIDLRPEMQEDPRLGGTYRYGGNSTARMLELLARLDPRGLERLTTHDLDLTGYMRLTSGTGADLVFLDAEHTPQAMLADLAQALALVPSPRIILMHDVEALAGREAAVESLAAAADRVAKLLSPSLLVLAREADLEALEGCEPRPLTELSKLASASSGRAAGPDGNTHPEPDGWVLSTTMAARGEEWLEALALTLEGHHAGGYLAPDEEVDPRPAHAPKRLILLEMFNPVATAFHSGPTDLGRLVLLPEPLGVLNALAADPAFPITHSWAALTDYLVFRVYGLSAILREAAGGPRRVLHGRPTESSLRALSTALAEGRGGTFGAPPELPHALPPPPLHPAARARLGEMPLEHWLRVREAWEFALNLAAIVAPERLAGPLR